MKGFGSDSTRALLLVLLAAVVTVSLQVYVGNETIYSDELKAKREELHVAIVTNRAPRGGTWAAIGASTDNIRIGAVYLAEGVHRATGLSIARTYILLDSIFLFALLIALALYLRRWADDTLCLVGLLYFAAVLPLTYVLHAFHPWDRPQLLLWILILRFVHDRRPVALGICLALSIAVKFDSILVPGFYFFCHVARDRWRAVAAETAALGALALACYGALRWNYPEPGEPPRFTVASVVHLVNHNVSRIAAMNLRYPPFLVFLIPTLLALPGLWRRERFVVASIFFALVLGVVWLLTTHAEEVRAEMVALVLLLPASLMTLRGVLTSERRVAP